MVYKPLNGHYIVDEEIFSSFIFPSRLNEGYSEYNETMCQVNQDTKMCPGA